MTSLLNTISATINHYRRLLIHNDAVAKQAAQDWIPGCSIHHMPRFRDILKVQEGKPEQDCWTCSLCEIERRRAALAQPKPKLINHSPGFMLLAVNAQEREYKQELIHRIAANRITTTPLASRDIQYENTPPILPDEEDDATERRPAIKLSKATTTQEIPAITAEITLMELMRGPVSPHDTGEQAPVKISEDAFLL